MSSEKKPHAADANAHNALITERDALRAEVAWSRKLYRVEIVATYTVTARSEAEALGLVLIAESHGGEVNIDVPQFDVRELGQGDVTLFYDDSTGKHLSVWGAHLDADEAQVIACSEWP